MKPMPATRAMAKSRRMGSEIQPSRCPFDNPLSRVTRNTVISPKPIQSNLRGGPEVARPGIKIAAINRPMKQKGTAMKKT